VETWAPTGTWHLSIFRPTSGPAFADGRERPRLRSPERRRSPRARPSTMANGMEGRAGKPARRRVRSE